ncbi:anthranilate synthase component I family protein [Pedobacter sp. Du54]|uniref:anthranilate synthase component I family protein n=1 Tax=Pedobacter anseongensis TaxID=3133439 RepID=UPI0030A00099
MNTQKSSIIKQKALQWANTYSVCCCLDSNQYTDPYTQYDYLIAVGAKDELRITNGDSFQALRNFYEKHKNWIFGLFSYELKNEIEQLISIHTDKLDFPDLFFFVPTYLLAIKNEKIMVLIGDESVLNTIYHTKIDFSTVKTNLTLESRFNRNDYISTVKQLQEHIKRGDIYEINFCQEFFAEHAIINPIAVYQSLNTISPTPFAGFFKIYDKFILSATPERFLCKRGNKLVSQPIKGTAKRSGNTIEDEKIKADLKSSAKEQAENVMIVDLVRNDLTKSAVKGSVKVNELFGIYTFPQVHQMISTISCELNPEVHFIDAIKNTFPMGSMTGAPKIKAMQLIDQYEQSKRGAFSGSFGCINPNGDFDFNVIIRSILYNATNNYLSFQVGGAITYAANAEEEYEECLLKASAILKVLN